MMFLFCSRGVKGDGAVFPGGIAVDWPCQIENRLDVPLAEVPRIFDRDEGSRVEVVEAANADEAIEILESRRDIKCRA